MSRLLSSAPAAQRAVSHLLYDTTVSSTSPASKGRVKAEQKECGEVVPRRVDHEERRRQIADALLRTAA
jgi:hypothetical protein